MRAGRVAADIEMTGADRLRDPRIDGSRSVVVEINVFHL